MPIDRIDFLAKAMRLSLRSLIPQFVPVHLVLLISDSALGSTSLRRVITPPPQPSTHAQFGLS